jgi:hypothetical protein
MGTIHRFNPNLKRAAFILNTFEFEHELRVRFNMAGVPNIFGNATTAIPLTQLDANFNTGLAIGDTTVGLGNTVASPGNLTLANVTIIGSGKQYYGNITFRKYCGKYWQHC